MKGVGTYGLKSIIGRPDSWYDPEDEMTEAEHESAWESWVDEYGSDPDTGTPEWDKWLWDHLSMLREPDHD